MNTGFQTRPRGPRRAGGPPSRTPLNGGARTEERAQGVLEAGRDAAWQAGFCAGMKAGARIVFSLMDESEVVC